MSNHVTCLKTVILSKRWTPEEAVEFMRERRPHILLHTKQWQALKEYHKRHVSGKGDSG